MYLRDVESLVDVRVDIVAQVSKSRCQPRKTRHACALTRLPSRVCGHSTRRGDGLAVSEGCVD